MGNIMPRMSQIYFTMRPFPKTYCLQEHSMKPSLENYDLNFEFSFFTHSLSAEYTHNSTLSNHANHMYLMVTAKQKQAQMYIL